MLVNTKEEVQTRNMDNPRHQPTWERLGFFGVCLSIYVYPSHSSYMSSLSLPHRVKVDVDVIKK